MGKGETLIIEEIEKFKVEYGGDYPDYYIGITKHIDKRLYEESETIIEHLQRGEYTKGNPTYLAETSGRETAINLERSFQEKGMLKFNPRSVGVEDSKFIYCYKMTVEDKKNILLENSNEGKKMKKYIKDYKKFKNE